ncbi:hypothetical protein SARI_03390 [Salmonella enterica subsp. arizonae serovar 62:z4,z23:-]|uniref:Uncharacterized protein n=1 Tax=Salmonella arizonae (strain ATCC BAA-731 / CDC346-86 / RSK2980) TaxID=41514 RepID=A9MGJ8_SALAR|nr:hypothetical protein SARI_03390 [Salmonella enterica subsp. arizonae serovar 62:z4,z23:-]
MHVLCHFFSGGLTLILRANFVQNPDEKQAVVSFDVSKENAT